MYNFKDKESQRIQETIFKEKRTIIENCLFGVDINPKSVHICRLRLWIELLKNAYYTIETNFKELETLPNIDINIKCGNSLISRFSLNGNTNKTMSPQKMQLATAKYKKAVSEYKNAIVKNQKQQAEKTINELKSEISRFANPTDKDYIEIGRISSEIDSQKIFFSEDEKKQWQMKIMRLTKELSEVQDRYDVKNRLVYGNSFEWRFEFPEVLDDNGSFVGFDAVIGNPPYLNFKMYSQEERNVFRTNYLEIFDGKADIYYYFFYQSLRILKNSGILSFITSRYWLEAEFAEKLRKYISEKYQLNEIIDFKNVTIFEGVGIKTSIAQITKQKASVDFSLNYRFIDSKKIKSVAISDFTTIPIKYNGILNKSKWTLSEENELSIIRKIELDTVKLEDIADCKQGIVTGLDKAFITTSNEFKDLPKELVKTWVKVGDIHKYCIIQVEKRELIYTNEIKNISDYPELEKRIAKFRTKLSERREAKSGKIRWFDLQWSRTNHLFDNPKLICRFKAPFNTFALDENKFYSSADTTIVTLKKDKTIDYNLKYLLGLLNSKLLDFYFKSYGKLMDYRFEYYPGPVGQIRIKKSKNQNEIIRIVDQILEIKSKNPNHDISEFEKEINQLVYEIYGIDSDEIQIIEKGQIK